MNWEYRLVCNFLTDELNELGLDGWEAVNAWAEEQYNGSGESPSWIRVCLMKRQVAESQAKGYIAHRMDTDR